jgi:dihydrofolate reductase
MKSALGCASFGWQAQSAKPKCPANLASTRTREGGRIEAAQREGGLPVSNRRCRFHRPTRQIVRQHRWLFRAYPARMHGTEKRLVYVITYRSILRALDGVRNWLRTRVHSALIRQRWRRATKADKCIRFHAARTFISLQDSDLHWRQQTYGHVTMPHHRRDITIQEFHAPTVKETSVSKLRVNALAVSADGFGAGPDQGRDQPLGRGGEQLHQWFLPTRTFQRNVLRRDGGTTGIDNDFAARSFENLGAWIMGRNMFGPVRGPWPDYEWKGWWGANPPYHVPVFVLTHHAAPAAGDGGRHRLPFRHRGDRGGAGPGAGGRSR